MNRNTIKTIQFGLNKHFGAKLDVDGLLGNKTYMAIRKVSLIPNHWPNARQLVGFIQVFALLEGIDAGPIDGWSGPQTDQALEDLSEFHQTGTVQVNWRDNEIIQDTGEASPSGLRWPLQTTKELNKFYGPVGENQTKVNVPYPLKLAWKTETHLRRFTCHEKVAPSIARVLDRVLDHYGDQISELGLDMWGGCLNVRKMRGGSKYSTHSWGCAIDWDPSRNRLKWKKDKANFAKPVYNKWWDLWEEEGWVSLGREKNFDWMHVQSARLR